MRKSAEAAFTLMKSRKNQWVSPSELGDFFSRDIWLLKNAFGCTIEVKKEGRNVVGYKMTKGPRTMPTVDLRKQVSEETPIQAATRAAAHPVVAYKEAPSAREIAEFAKVLSETNSAIAAFQEYAAGFANRLNASPARGRRARVERIARRSSTRQREAQLA